MDRPEQGQTGAAAGPSATPAAAPPRARRRLLRVALRLAVVIAAAAVLNLLLGDWITRTSEARLAEGLGGAGPAQVAMALIFYAVLLAIPFVPGAEIGIALLMMEGPSVAGFVYLATILGLGLAFAVGRALDSWLPCAFLKYLGMPEACAFIDRMKRLDQPARLALLEASAPAWVARWLVGRRHVLIGVLFNLPGNSLLGGGGGLALLAGMSGLYSWRGFGLTVCVATAPVPLLVLLFGDMLPG